jgi:C4-dicarboxylate transporter DctM subunit
MIESLIGFAAVLVLVLLRMPIAFAMGLVGMAGMTYETNFRAAISMVSRLIIDTSQDYGLSVVPLFILMGLFVNKGGISRELYQVSNAFLGHLRGGLAMATIAACGGFRRDLRLVTGDRGHHVQGRDARNAQARLFR